MIRVVMLADEVIERFREGDDDAVRLVYREYGRLVYTVAFRVLGHRELAEEATQQAFVQAWRGAARLRRSAALWARGWRPSPAVSPSTSTAAKPAAPPATSMTYPPTMVHSSRCRRLPIRSTIHGRCAGRRRPPPDEQEVVRLQHLEGFTHSEIADHLGVPIGTVKSRAFRAHRRLAGAPRSPAWRPPMNQHQATDVHTNDDHEMRR